MRKEGFCFTKERTRQGLIPLRDPLPYFTSRQMRMIIFGDKRSESAEGTQEKNDPFTKFIAESIQVIRCDNTGCDKVQKV